MYVMYVRRSGYLLEMMTTTDRMSAPIFFHRDGLNTNGMLSESNHRYSLLHHHTKSKHESTPGRQKTSE